MKEKTELKISAPYGFGYYEYFAFMHVRPSKSDKKRVCCVNHEAYSCREFFIRAMRFHMLGQSYKTMETSRTYVAAGIAKVNTEASLALQRNALESRFERSLAILNALESKVKWPRTKMIPLKPTNPRNLVPCALFIGPRAWNRSPYLMSLFTLIIRAGQQKWMPDSIKGKSWKEMKPIIKKSFGKDYDLDRKWVRESIDYWLLILSNFKHLFGYRNRAWQWSYDRLSSNVWATSEGIHKLISGSTYYKGLRDKFHGLKKEANSNESSANKS